MIEALMRVFTLKANIVWRCKKEIQCAKNHNIQQNGIRAQGEVHISQYCDKFDREEVESFCGCTRKWWLWSWKIRIWYRKRTRFWKRKFLVEMILQIFKKGHSSMAGACGLCRQSQETGLKRFWRALNGRVQFLLHVVDWKEPLKAQVPWRD